MSVPLSACVLVSLLSCSAAAPAADACSQQTKPLRADELHRILGHWILIEAVSNNDLFDSVLGYIETFWMTLNATADNTTLLLHQANFLPERKTHPEPQQPQNPEMRQEASMDESITMERVETQLPLRKGRCLRAAHNVSLVDGKALEFHFKVAATYHRFLQTCIDCLLMHTYTKENTYQALYLFGRTSSLAASDLEAFRKQTACLQFPLPAKFHYDTNTELCPL